MVYSPDMDRAYANGAFIAGSADLPPRWLRDAAGFRDGLGARARLGLAYGPGARQRFDLFMPDTAAPRGVMVFVHGGYWLDFDRGSWSHLAAGALTRGWACAMPSYTLAPAARIADMTVEVAGALRAVSALVPGPVVVCGHSAGGHLAARMGCADVPVAADVARVVPISPLAELSPLIQTAMNADLCLTQAECATESPARLALRQGCAAHVWVGAQERPAFLWQARLLSEAWDCPWTVEPARHHFDVINGLVDAQSALMAACLDGF